MTDSTHVPNAIPASVFVRYVESEDGFEWEEKSRCQIQTSGQTSFDGFTVFIDPKGPSDERYKAVYTTCPLDSKRSTLLQEFQKIHPRYKDLRMWERYQRISKICRGYIYF